MHYDVIFGISCSGKSTYIKKHYQNEVVVFPYEINFQDLNQDKKFVIHYNALRPWHNKADRYDSNIKHDKVASLIFEKRKPLCVKILIAKKSTLIIRAENRALVEPLFYPESKLPYPKNTIIEFITKISPLKIYKVWIKYFNKQRIYYEFILTEAGENYRILTQKEALKILRI